MNYLLNTSGVQVASADSITYSVERRAWLTPEVEFSDYDGTAYTVSETPGVVPVVVPQSVTPRQARLILALTQSGDENFPTMLAKVEAAFGSLPEPDKTVAQITWEYSTEVQRTNPLVAQMKAVIGFTDEQIDQLFIQAATL